jgi:hypothetical protein
LLALVSGDDDGAIALAESGQQLDHLVGRFYVHVGEGLVEEQQLRDGHQDAGERVRWRIPCSTGLKVGPEIRIEADDAGLGGFKRKLDRGRERRSSEVSWPVSSS